MARYTGSLHFSPASRGGPQVSEGRRSVMVGGAGAGAATRVSRLRLCSSCSDGAAVAAGPAAAAVAARLAVAAGAGAGHRVSRLRDCCCSRELGAWRGGRCRAPRLQQTTVSKEYKIRF